MANSTIILHQFPTSHFNEKARWGLDWKGIDHQRKNYLPGPHMLPIRRLSGQTSVPVLTLGRRVVAGSAKILDVLEQEYPQRPLYPEDGPQRERALEIQRHFDREVGPAVRTALFSVLIDEPGYLCSLFASVQPWPLRTFYRGSFPLVKGLIAKAHDTDDAGKVEQAFRNSEKALDFVSARVEASGQLVGEHFSVADLSCAALLAPLLDLSHPDMKKPRPMPVRIEDFLERWKAHPAALWVQEQYAKYRPVTE